MDSVRKRPTRQSPAPPAVPDASQRAHVWGAASSPVQPGSGAAPGWKSLPGTPSRRQFLAACALLLAGGRAAQATEGPNSGPVGRGTRSGTPGGALNYDLRFGILFGAFSYGVLGTVYQDIDRAAGRYRVTLLGEGIGVKSRVEAAGLIRDGRFLPLSTRSSHTIRGRENTLAVDYDHEAHRLEYHGVAHTFFLGRRRQVDDVLGFPDDRQVDDLVSASLNFAADKLERYPDGTSRIWVVRRTRPENEGPDDVSPSGYRVELVPIRFKPVLDPGTGRLTAFLDLGGFSSWARPGHPAKVVFGSNRFLELIDCSLILGSSMSVRIVDRTAVATGP